MTRLIIVGAGGHGSVLAEAAVLSKIWSSVCFVDDRQDCDASVVGFPVLGSTELLGELVDEETRFFVAIGQNRYRDEALSSIREQGGSLANVIHPAAVVSPSALVESGTGICAGAVVNARASIGRGSIINTSATIDHDCILGCAVHISPGAHLAGGVTVGDRSWIGIGAVVKEGISIGDDCVVGAGASVVEDVGSGMTVVGVPARPMEKP